MNTTFVRVAAIATIALYWFFVSASQNHSPAEVRLSVYINENQLPLNELERVELLQEVSKEIDSNAKHFDFLAAGSITFLLIEMLLLRKREK